MTTFRKLYPTSGQRDVNQVVNEVRDGKLNSVREFTLTPNVVVTTVIDPLASTSSFIGLMPLTASAYAAQAGGMLVQINQNGEILIVHPSAAFTDQTFRYVVLG
ncbi:hypothetical protein [Inquilinus limosus]|uniref:Uncharacterized protein n=1 Tax=Inquilinus limosus TaxID=171674 RepID=A0A211ZQS3_9PROT|nr:hypothetical protein [Inquilinus limosus]OWJ67447.1 hypothetical protein BWR60_09585 [Inquilinus limosus]